MRVKFMLKICLVNTFFPPWRGGAETYVYNLAKHLSNFGHEVCVYCASNPEKPGRYLIDGIKVCRLKSIGWLYGVPIVPNLFAALSSAEADIFHANFPNPYNASVTSAISLLKGVPALITWHNDLPSVTKAARVLVAFHDKVTTPIYLREFKRIIATTKAYAEESKILKRYLRKVVVVPNGVDCEKFNPKVKGDEVRAKYGLEHCKVVLFVGALTRWHRYKGLDILIKAFHSISQLDDSARLLIVGEGSLKKEYQSLCRSLKLSGKVFFAGNVQDEDLQKFYAASDVLVLPSKDRSEGFGLTLLEANACGKPVIGSMVGGIPDVIKHEYNGLLVPPSDDKALAQAVLRVLKDVDLAFSMGSNGRKIAEAHDWRIIARAVEKVYYETLKNEG
jgi:glycosyltransferase involved in cell wall biosynthesis